MWREPRRFDAPFGLRVLAQLPARRVEQEIARRRRSNYKPDLSLWVYKSAPDLMDDLLGEYSWSNILSAVEVLIDLGFLKMRGDAKVNSLP